MALGTEILRNELADVRKKLAQAKLDLEEVQIRLGKLQQQQNALTVLLDGRDESEDRSEVTPTLPEDFQPTLGATEHIGSADEMGVNKTEAIRQIIREGGANGATPTDIWQGIQKRKIQMHRNYIYAVLARLAEKNEIREHGGRYLLTQPQ